MVPKEEKGAELFCDKCGRMCDAEEIQACPLCTKRFCSYCTFRRGGRDYCSRACGEVFFFGGDFGEDEIPEE